MMVHSTAAILLVLLLLLQDYSSAQDAFSCISTYGQLKDILRNNKTDNIETLLDVFYPPNESTVHSVNVTYRFISNTSTCSDSFTYQWSSNALLLVVEPDLLDALSFKLFDLISRDLNLVMTVSFCSCGPSNLLLLDTLSTWLKSYANSNSETIQGYAVHYDTISGSFLNNTYDINRLRGFTLAWLLFVSICMTIVLNVRLCSKKVTKRTEQIAAKVVESTYAMISIVEILKEIWKQKKTYNEPETKTEENRTPETFEKSIEESIDESKTKFEQLKDKTKYLSNISSVQNILLYILAVMFFLIWDSVTYHEARKYRITDWYAFFPLPLIVPLVFVFSFIVMILTGTIVLLRRRAQSKTLRICLLFKKLITVPLLSVLVTFVMFHGFWIILMIGTYPDRIATTALFIIPLYFPSKLLFQTLCSIVKSVFERLHNNFEQKRKLKMYFRDWINILLDNLKLIKDLPKHFIQIIEVSFFIVFWSLLLAVLYLASDFLLVVTDIRNDPIRLIAFVIITTVLTHRLVKVCKNNEEQDEPAANTKKEKDDVIPSTPSVPRRRQPPLPPIVTAAALPSQTDADINSIYETVSLHTASSSNDIEEGVYTMAEHQSSQ